MPSQRMFISLIALSSVAMALSSTIYANNLILGSRVPNDHLLEREFVKKTSQWLQVVKESRTFTGDNYSKITQIKLLDQNKKGDGGKATVVSGGPGLSFVGIDFKSKYSHSIDFIVEIYGK